jgi:hypothetical protein
VRPPFLTRTIRLVGPLQRDTAIAALQNIPLDPERPIELVLREERKVRGLDMNAAMWAGPLREIAEQAWVNGRQYSAEVWHEFMKQKYLPEDNDPELAELVKDGYRKWDIDPAGNRVLVGSTTKLTRKGMHQYLLQIEAEGAGIGVMFTARAA